MSDRNLKWKTWNTLGLIVAVAIFLLPLQGGAQQTNPAAAMLKKMGFPVGMGQVWEGRITFSRNDSKDKDVEETSGGKTTHTVDHHSVKASATIMFCGAPSAGLNIWGYKSTWSEDWKQGKQEQYRSTKCPDEDSDGKPTTRSVSPGNEDTEMRWGKTTLYPESKVPPKEHSLRPHGRKVAMIPMMGGYRLIVEIEQFLDFTEHNEALETNVCTGDRETVNGSVTTVDFSQKPVSSSSGDENNKIYSTERHPIKNHPFALIKQIQVKEGQEVIEGDQKLVEEQAEKPGEWNRLTQVEWRIRMKNYCDDVFDALYTDLAFAEAFNDPNLRTQTDDLGEYKELATDRAGQTYSGNGPDQDRFTGARMEVNPATCRIEGADEAKESLEERCLPMVIYDAVHAHERRHVEQCKFDPEMGSGSISKTGSYETDAYMAGARVYIGWLNMNCPHDHRLAVAKERMAVLKASKSR